MTILVMLCIIFLGVRAYVALPVSAMPNVDYPVITINAIYPGASPKTMGNTIATPIETECSSIDGLQKMSSHSIQSQTTIVLEFEINKTFTESAQEVQAAINRALPNLPQDLPNAPTYSGVNPSVDPILYLAFYSDEMPYNAVYDWVDNFVGKRISMVDGIAKVQVYGAPFAVRVQLNPQKLAAKKISFSQVTDAIRKGTVNFPTGSILGKSRQFSIDPKGQLFDAASYKKIPVRQKGAGVLDLSELGTVIDSSQDLNMKGTYGINGKQRQCVFLTLQRKPGENTIDIVKNVRSLLPKLLKNAPASLEMDVFYDKAHWIKDAIFDVKMTFLIAFILVLIVVYIYLGTLVNTFIPMIVLPLAILGTFIVMYFLNYSIDILSLLAITLAIGFLVDDAIVVLENTHRHIEKGKPPLEAALIGSKEISITILSITLALIAAFIPMIFMSGMLGKIFREFSLTIVIAVLFSGFLALSLTPLLCSRMLKKDSTKTSWMEKFSNKLNTFLIDKYKIALAWSLDHGKTVLAAAMGSIVLSCALFVVLPKGFFPEDDLGIIIGFSQFRSDASPERSVALQKKIDKAISDDPNIARIVSIAGQPPGNTGMFFPALTDPKKRPSAQKIIRDLYHNLQPIYDAKVFLISPKLINLGASAMMARGAYSISLQSQNEESLLKALPGFVEKMHGLEGFVGINTPQQEDFPYLEITIDRQKAGYLNVSAQAIEGALQQAYAQGKVTTISTPTSLHDVIVQVEPAFYQKPESLKHIYVQATNGQLVPLSAIASWKITPGAQSIDHLNNMPSASIYFSLHDKPLLEAMQEVEALAKNHLPEDVFVNFEGSAGTFGKSLFQFLILFFLALFAIYAILGILYESFIHPISAISAIPPATLGAFFTLLIFHQMFSIYAFVGLMMLLGIVMKNGILIIEFAIQGLKNNPELSAKDAIFDAAVTRFRPILMTTLAAMMGAVPIALGIGGTIAKSRASLGLVIIGGLLFSQMLTLFLTPRIFLYLEDLRKKYSLW